MKRSKATFSGICVLATTATPESPRRCPDCSACLTAAVIVSSTVDSSVYSTSFGKFAFPLVCGHAHFRGAGVIIFELWMDPGLMMLTRFIASRLQLYVLTTDMRLVTMFIGSFLISDRFPKTPSCSFNL